MFIDVAWKLPQYRFVGIARKTGFPKKQLPNNVKMLFDVDETTFNDYLKKCSVVFMPINVKTQGGQIVIFKGGLYRKAVVTTDTAAIRTYIADGRNGLLTRFKDSQSAIQALNKVMDNDNFRNNLGNGLYDDIRQLTPTHFVDLLTDFLKKKRIQDMKIGLLTYYGDLNCGTNLQAYATFSAIKNVYPNDTVEVIPFHGFKPEIDRTRVSIRQVSSEIL